MKYKTLMFFLLTFAFFSSFAHCAYEAESKIDCGEHSYYSAKDDTCYCEHGYIPSEDGMDCIKEIKEEPNEQTIEKKKDKYKNYGKITDADSSDNSEELKSEDVYKKVSTSIMTLKVLNRSGSVVIGSAFISIKDGVAVTSWHVVKNAKYVVATFSDGQEFDVSGLIDKDIKRDVALIRVKAFERPLLRMTTTDPSVGEKAYVIGSPLGLDFTISEGLISQIRTVEGMKFYQFSCAASPGNSGGPIVNSSGEVLGVVTFQFKEGQNLNFAVPSIYALGLDSSLPTVLFENVKIDNLEENPFSPKEMSENDIDIFLAKTLVQHFDNMAALVAIENSLHDPVFADKKSWKPYVGLHTKRTFNIPKIPYYYYSSYDQTKEIIDVMEKLRFESFRENARGTLLSALKYEIDAFDLIRKAIEIVQSNLSWTPEANNLMSQATSKYDSAFKKLPINDDDLTKLLSFPDFEKEIPHDTLHIIKNDSVFKLGVYFMSDDPMRILLVKRDTKAESIGLKTGDRIIGTEEKEFVTFEEFKIYLSENAGNKVFINIQRDGKYQELKIKVPKDITKP